MLYQTQHKMITLLFLMLGISLLFLQCSRNTEESSGQKEENTPRNTETSFRRFETSTVQPENIVRRISLTGRVIPIQKVTITSEVQGRVLPSSGAFEEGITFNKGDLLLDLDSQNFIYQLKAQRSEFIHSLVRIMSDMKLDYPSAFDTWNTYLEQLSEHENLPDLPAINDKQLRYFLAANRIYELFYSIKNQEESLKDYQIYAPFDGVVTLALVDPGDLVRPGLQLGEMSRTDIYEVKAAVSASELPFLQTGQSLSLYSRTLGQSWEAYIHRFGKSIDPTTQSVSVYLRVGGNSLQEGMYLEGQIEADTLNHVVEINRSLLTRDNQIYTLKDSLVRLKTVRPIQYAGETVMVQGLSDGELIITEPISTSIQGIRSLPK